MSATALVQWLVFRDDGSRTAAGYAAAAGSATVRNGVVGPDDFVTRASLGQQGRLQRRQAFVLKLMRQIMQVMPASELAQRAKCTCDHDLGNVFLLVALAMRMNSRLSDE